VTPGYSYLSTLLIILEETLSGGAAGGSENTSKVTKAPASVGTGTNIQNKTFTGAKSSATVASPGGSGGLSTGSLIAVIGGVIVGVAIITIIIGFFFVSFALR
jgi:hypothetical protein